VANAPQGAVRLKSRALFRLVKNTVLAGQPIMEEQLYAVGEVPLLSDQVPPGYRAVTLSIDANSALNGVIQPDSLVDVTLTAKNDRPDLGNISTFTLLTQVKVLATSRSRWPASEDRAGDIRNITVAVTPEQANKLILAQKFGTLSVTLCGTAEPTQLAALDSDRHMVNPFDLLGLAPVKPVPARPAKTAQIWRGSAVTVVKFDEGAIQEAENATVQSGQSEPTPAVPVSKPQPQSPTLAPPQAVPGEPTAAAEGPMELPTLDQPAGKPTAALPAGLTAPHPGQVIDVRIEAEQTGAPAAETKP